MPKPMNDRSDTSSDEVLDEVISEVQVRHRARSVTAASAAVTKPEPTSQDYEVGYKRPPQHSRFPKGRSGNPRGRPKGAKSVTSLTEELLNTRMRARIDGKERTLSRKQVMLEQLMAKALSGDLKAMNFLFSLSGEAGGPRNHDKRADRQHELVNAAFSAADRAIVAHNHAAAYRAQGFDEQTIAKLLELVGLSDPAVEPAEGDESERD
jgi:hypothetical protein